MQGCLGRGGRMGILAAKLLATAALASSGRGATAADIERGRGEHAPYRLTTPHFDVEFSVLPSVGLKYAGLCERAYANFRKKFHVPEDEVVWDGRCRVKLFARREEFVAFARAAHKSHAAAESGGYTRITKADPDIVLYLRDGDQARLQQVLVHEMTHVFLQLFHNDAKIDVWLHEGFAQHFEFQVQPERSRLKASRERAKELVRGGKARPLATFWTASFPPTDLDGYAQAWSLVDFMVTKGSAKRTGRFILAIKDGKDQETALQESFGCSLDKFEGLWKRYVVQAY